MNTFKGSSFNEFLFYIHHILQSESDKNNKQLIKNKYIKIKNQILQYVIVNEKSITTKIINRNRKK